VRARRKLAAGLLMYRRSAAGLELLLVHPGGPFWKKKDLGAWSIPKGELAEGEDLLATARREFQEETGLVAPGPWRELSPVRQKSGKVVYAWAFEGDCDPAQIRSNELLMEWPPDSGSMLAFPEVDRAEFFSPREAKRKLNPAQIAWVDELIRLLGC
jgi:predicted NUDIX family NTP pyrophosphohydrolase